MLNVLATSAEIAKLILYYGSCFIIIAVALIAIAFLKHKTRKEMRTETVKKRCIKAKAYAQSLLNKKETAKLLASTKLLKLDSLIEEAAWLSFQIFEGKKDIFFEGIANSLDALATAISEETANGYIPTEIYQKNVEHAVRVLGEVVSKLDILCEKKEEKK